MRLTTKTIRRRSLSKLDHDLPDSLHPVLRRVYLARNLTNAKELDRSLKNLLPLQQLKGVDTAVALLEEAMMNNWRIVIVADFDADGATSCAVVVRALRAMGARNVDYVIPNRIIHGYGLTPAIVAVAARFSPDLLVTVDNGISSIEGVAAARALGIRVLITDHHLPGLELPVADAVVNPNCPDNDFPSKGLAGVGVIFYVMLALRAHLRARGWFEGIRAEPNLGALLDLVALGTVADVVPLDHNNRILVARGLARIRAGMACPGIAALLAVAERAPERVTTTDLGFFVGPRLNAAGRLEDMTIGVECLLADDATQAHVLAVRLDTLNRERRAIEAEMQDQALEELERLELDAEAELPWGLVLYDAAWHPGVIGILASRIKDRFNRPVIAFAPGGEQELRGSARGITKLHIRDILESIATAHPKMFCRFGGHAMAAGLTIPKNQLSDFATSFDAEIRRRLAPEDLHGVIFSDGALKPDDFSLELAEILRSGGPWGQGFPEPIFDGVFQCLDSRMMGERHLKLRVCSTEGSKPLDAIVFNYVNYPDCFFPRPRFHLRLAYRLDVNQYQDNCNPQLVVEYMESMQ
ncbi:ssDNA-specific exonuclease RecJ [Gammaproteobacteria bacterium]